MELHDGTLSAASEGEGRGSTFSIQMPLFKEAATVREDSEYGDVEIGNSKCSFQDLQWKLAKPKTENTKPLLSTSSKNRRSSALVVPMSDDKDVPCDQMDSLIDSQSLMASQVVHLPLSNQNLRPQVKCWNEVLRILIVDDSVPNRKVMKRLLASHGHIVTEAVDGVEFLHCLGYELEGGGHVIASNAYGVCDSNNFDVTLIDDNMPRLNGSNSVALVRKAGYSGIIVGITGNAEMECIQRFKDKGADDVMSKPIDIQELKKRIKKLLARKS